MPAALRARLVAPEVRAGVGEARALAQLGDVSSRLAGLVRARDPVELGRDDGPEGPHRTLASRGIGYRSPARSRARLLEPSRERSRDRGGIAGREPTPRRARPSAIRVSSCFEDNVVLQAPPRRAGRGARPRRRRRLASRRPPRRQHRRPRPGQRLGRPRRQRSRPRRHGARVAQPRRRGARPDAAAERQGGRPARSTSR